MHHDPTYERSSAYIDESFSPQRKGTPIYALAAVVIAGDSTLIRKRLQERFAGVVPFKTSTLANMGHGDKVMEMLDWIATNAKINVVVAQMPYQGHCESARQICLATLLIELNGLRVNRVVLDSRGSPFARDPKRLDRLDRRTVHELREQKFISRNMEALHYTEIQEPLVWLADAVAWSAQRHISLLSSDHWSRVESMSRIIQLDAKGCPK